MKINVADKKSAHRELIVNEHMEAEAVRHDVTATVKTFKHPRYEVPALGVVADGAEAVNGLLGTLLTAFPDFHIEKTAVHHAEDAVIVECRLQGTQRGEPESSRVERRWRFLQHCFSCSRTRSLSAKESISIMRHSYASLPQQPNTAGKNG
jgi:hypothetical protein